MVTKAIAVERPARQGIAADAAARTEVPPCRYAPATEPESNACSVPVRLSYADHSLPVSIMIGGCDGPYTGERSVAAGTPNRVLPLLPSRKEMGCCADDPPSRKRVGNTPLTVSQLIEILKSDGGPDLLFRQLPELDPQDVRNAVDYAAGWGLL